MAFCASAIVRPTLFAKVAWQLVAVRPKVQCPSHAQRIQNERSEIEVGVGRCVISALEADVKRPVIFPCATESSDIDRAEHRVQRLVNLLLIGAQFARPEKMKDLRAAIGKLVFKCGV
jgi:hypothetical protein